MKIISLFFTIFMSLAATFSVSGQSGADYVARGDSLLQHKQFDEAIRNYRQSLAFNDSSQAVLTKIDKAHQREKEASQNYQQALQKGQQYLSNKEYKKAREAFKTALANKPDARYPQLKLEEIREAYQDPELERKYNKYVNTADSLMDSYNYQDALSFYNKALKINPREVELLKKTKKLKKFIEKQKQREKEYAQTITEAQRLFENQAYNEAMMKYQEASLIKPDKELPETKIEQIRSLIKKREKRNRSYEQLVSQADSLYMDRQFKQAKAAYQRALEIKPSENYPVSMIAKIDPALAEKKQLNQAYARLIEQADLAFKVKDYDEARELYSKAAEKDPSKDYPTRQINRIRKQIAARAARYDSLISVADNRLEGDQLLQAKNTYQKAAGIYSDSAYPRNQIAKVEGLLADVQKREDAFQSAVARGDSLLKQNDLIGAKAAFEQAAATIPSKDYPTQKLNEINRQLAANANRYDSLINLADNELNGKNLMQAKSNYQKAADIYQDSTYPRNQITKVEGLLADAKEKEASYKTAVARGDSLLKDNELKAAKSAFEDALSLFNAKEYPRQKIDEINRKLATRKEKQQQYSAAIASADSLFENELWQQARKKYQAAARIFPAESYPETQLVKTDDRIAKQNAREKQYDKIIAKADSLFGSETYEAAKEQYRAALQVLAEKSYPRRQIDKADSLIEQHQIKLKAYDDLLAKADRFLDKKEYNEALSLYQDAEDLFPDKKYAKEKIAIINNQLADQEAREKAYQKAVRKADSLYNKEAYENAITYYQKALEQFEDRSYPDNRIAQCQDIIANLKAKEQMYDEIVATADSLYEQEAYDEARESYKNALEVKSGETYPKEQIERIKQTLQNIEQEFNRAMAKGSSAFSEENYKQALTWFKKAADLKAETQEPKERIAETEKILEEKHRQMMEEYNKIITQADAKHQNKYFSEAIELYRQAANLNTEADYPREKIAAIRKYLKEHSLRDVLKQRVTLSEGGEKKFTFSPLSYRDRSNNFVVIKASKANKKAPKIFLNYGKDDTKNGGVVIPSVQATEAKQYIINLSDHSRWYNNENNWISLYVAGGDLNVENISIVKSD